MGTVINSFKGYPFKVVLLILIIGIWVLIIRKTLVSEPEKGISSKSNGASEIQLQEQSDSQSYTPQFKYQDPFYPIETRSLEHREHSVTTKKESLISRKSSPLNGSISFHGLIKNKFNNIGIVRINGAIKSISKGDTIMDYFVVAITRDSILLREGNHFYFLKK